jgi:hypothetical protein
MIPLRAVMRVTAVLFALAAVLTWWSWPGARPLPHRTAAAAAVRHCIVSDRFSSYSGIMVTGELTRPGPLPVASMLDLTYDPAYGELPECPGLQVMWNGRDAWMAELP